MITICGDVQQMGGLLELMSRWGTPKLGWDHFLDRCKILTSEVSDVMYILKYL